MYQHYLIINYVYITIRSLPCTVVTRSKLTKIFKYIDY